MISMDCGPEDFVTTDDILTLLVGNQSLSFRGTWQFDGTNPAGTKADFSLLRVNFNYLVNLKQKNYLIHPDDIATIEKLLRSSDITNQEVELRIITSSGHLKSLKAAGQFVSSESVYRAKQTDVDKFSNHDELQLKVFKYAEQVGRIGSWTWKIESDQLFLSDHYYRLTGLQHHDTLSWQAISKLVHPEDRERFLRERKMMLESFEPMTSEYRVVRADGALRYMKDKIDLFVTETGALYFIGITHDITREVLPEQESQKQKQLYLKSLDALPQMVWVSNAEGRIQFLNDQWFIYSGLTPEQTNQVHLKDLPIFHPSQVKEIIPGFNSGIASGRAFQGETLLRNAKGEYRWHVGSGRPIYNDKNVIENWIGTFADVDDVYASEKRLKESNDLLDAVFNASVNGVQVYESVYDEKHEIVDFKCNRQNTHGQESLSGKIRIGNCLLKELPGMTESGLFNRYREVIRTGKPDEFEHHYSWDGLKKWFHTGIGNAEDNLVVATHDITEHKLKDLQLKENKQFIQTLIESSVDKLMVIDKDLKCILCNKPFEKQLNIRRQDVIGKHLFEALPMLRQKPKLLEALHHALAGHLSHIVAEAGVYGLEYADVYFIPMRDKQNKVHSVLNVVHDITQMIQQEKEVKRLNESIVEKNYELESINEELSTFAFIASHDLREPLRKMQLFSDILIAREAVQLTTQGRDIFAKMMGSVNRMNSLLDEILTFSRVSSGRPKMLVFNMDQIVELVKSDLKELIDSKQAKIISEPLPEFYGNPLQISLLLSNLITNGIKFQKHGNTAEIRISAEIMKANTIDHPRILRDKEYMKLVVTDNGIGLEEQYSQKIFQIFQRLHTSTQFPGTGMGLAVCKKVVENHHGFILVRSSPDNGATFTCYLPVFSAKKE